MASITDYLSTGSPQTPVAWQIMGMTPGNTNTAPNLREDAGIATNRALKDYGARTLPDLNNQAAAMGNFGSSGAREKVRRAKEDAGRNIFDVNRLLYRNLASIAKNKMMASIGAMF